MATVSEHDVVYAAGAKTMHYLAAGPDAGPLVIFVHGFPLSAITWTYQIDAFAGLGFRVVAPDMPGYGQSTARHVVEDYGQEALVEGLLALLADTGRAAAVWIGHDWGAATVSSVATQRPDVVLGLVGICVPHGTIERGWEGFLPLVNRARYPAAAYAYGQWEYQKYFEEHFDECVARQDAHMAAVLTAMASRPPPPPADRFAPTARVRQDGGFLAPPGAPGPAMLPAAVLQRYIADLEAAGAWGPVAYYLNHARNAAYNGGAASGGRLAQPVLFVHAQQDTVCDTKTSRLAEPMRRLCANLTEATVDAGHLPQWEAPAALNAALLRFILEELPGEWPGFWDGAWTKGRQPPAR